ncbi:MAG: class I SAM-dependent rRNA methyltransferase [Pseudomonadota bacterium]
MSRQPADPAAAAAAAEERRAPRLDEGAAPRHGSAAGAAERRPSLRLKPKCGGRFFAGAPWIYANELVLDRRAKALAPGAIATLEDSARQPVATVAVNTASQIAARALDRDPGAEIDGAWLEARLRRALSLRERLYAEPFYRLAHAEADGLPGLVIDRFGDALAVQPNAAWLETRRIALLAALDRVLAPRIVVWSGGSRARRLEGLPAETRLMKGTLDAPLSAPMNGAVYRADLLAGQKTGLFYDQRPNHAAFAALARGGRVLDVFAHVGGFSLAALLAGARAALAIDASAPALSMAEAGAEESGVADRFTTMRADAFEAMRALSEAGERFDAVVCDPPAFAPNKAALEQGLRAYAKTARLGVALTGPNGVFCLCSCSHAVGRAALASAAAAAFRAHRREARLIHDGGAGPDHPVHPALAETAYLKALIYVLD